MKYTITENDISYVLLLESIGKPDSLISRFFTFIRSILGRFLFRKYYSVSTEENLQALVDLQLSEGGTKNLSRIVAFIQQDFDRLCSYYYRKFSSGSTGLKRLQIDREDFREECYLVLVRRLSNKNESMRKLGDNQKIFLSNFIKSRAIEFTRKKTPSNVDIEKDENSQNINNNLSNPKYKTPEKLLLEKEARNKISSIINKLAPHYKEAIEYHYYYGFKPKQIAEMQGVEITIIYDRLKAAKRKLKEAFKKAELEIDLSLE